jgi:hypothetical protein
MIGGRIVQLLESIITGGSVKLAAGNNNIGQVGIDPNNNAIQLSGSIPEYSWFDGDAEPTPTDVEEVAFGVKFNTVTGAITVYGWSGTAWVEVA